MKRIIILLILLIALSSGSDKGEVRTIAPKVYAKGKPKKVKKKKLKNNYEYIGEFTITAYCGCNKCCGKSDGITSTGVKAKANHTIAVDPKVIPYQSKVVINGMEYTAEDCGGGIRGKHIDIYFKSHDEALDFGRQKAKVYLKKPPKLISKLKKSKVVLYANME